MLLGDLAIFLFCGIGKPFISDESIRAGIFKARAKVARVSEDHRLPAVPVLVVEAGDAADVEELGKDAEQHYTNLCWLIIHVISTSGGDTPRAAIIAAIREQYKLRKH